MWDKMETPTIVYDLDTSGGLMEKIQTLLAPPKSRDSENTGRKPEREARRSGRTTNHSTCDSCREGGDLLCCDHCPAAFHLQCCNPPLNEEKLPPGNWMCHRCNVRSKKREQKADQTNGLPERPISKYSSSPEVELDHGSGPLRLDGVLSGAGAGGPALRMTAVPQVRLLERRCSSRTNSRPGTPTSNASSAPSEEQNEAEEVEEEAHGSDPERTTVSAPAPRLLKRPFQLLITAAMERNPTQFQLPNELTCTSTLPGSSKRRRREELIGKIFKKPRLETDPNGLVPLPVKVCFTCTRSCRMAPLVQCDYCPLLFHMECLDPPLTTMPTGDWMCPHHTEHLVMNPNLSNRCQLFDQFQDRMSQHAVKVDFLRWVHRRNLPNHPSIHQHKRKTIKVPDGIKSQYHSPPLMLAPPGVRGGELVCSGVPEHKHAAQHSTSQAEQQEWLQDIIALQCSIMQHSSSKQKSSPWSNWDSRVHPEKADMKSCVETEEHSTLPSSIRTASTTPCSKPCSTLNVPQGTAELKILKQGGHCTCAVRPCLNCNKKPNGPLVELLPTIDPRPVLEAAASDPSRQADPHHRLNPPKTPPAPAQTPSPGVPNHIGEVEVKTESSSPLKLCSSGDCPPSHRLCSVIGPEHPAHIKGSSQTVCGERTQTTHKTVKDFSASKLATFSPSSSIKTSPGALSSLLPSCSGSPSGVKTSPGALSSLLPSSLSSLAHLSGSWTAAIDGDGELEMSKLDVELVKLLALQRIEQLFPPKAPPTPPSSCAVPLPNTRALKPQTTHTDPQTDVQARAVFYPLMGKGLPISMCYRALYIGSGADMDVCLTNYGQCNYVSGKHACIFYDENTKHYELLNYSEHGTTVDNVLYSCDFSEKPPPSPASSPGSKLPGVVRRCKARELEERSGGLVGLMPAGGVMSCQPQGGHRLPCSCKASSSSLIGGSGAGWEGTALLHHGSYIKLGCLQFVFSIAELANKLPKEETANKVTATDTPNQKGADKSTLSHNVPLQCTTPIP